jgi:hypothetical protein
MDLETPRISSKVVVIGLLGLITIGIVGYMIYLVMGGTKQHGSLSFSTGVNNPESTPVPNADQSIFSPFTSSLQPMIASCKMSYFGACITPPAFANGSAISTETKYENFAQDDIFYWLNKYPINSLVTARTMMDQNLAKEYFPEYNGNVTSQGKVDVAVTALIQRVSAKQNINPRVLFALMELLHKGSGVLLGSNYPLDEVYFQKQGDLSSQVTQVATELRLARTKYVLMEKNNQGLPQKVTFFDKEYQVKNSARPEDLALAEFLGKHLTSRRDFEKAIGVFPTDQDLVQAQVGQGENFVAIYKMLFAEDPIKAQ